MRRLVGLGALTLVGAIAVTLAGWIFYSRAAFGTWNPLAQPTRISYCSRGYLPGWQHSTRAQIEARGNGPGTYQFRQVGITAGGAAFFARPLPDNVRYQYGSPPLPCDMTVYLKVGADDYITYGILGGP